MTYTLLLDTSSLMYRAFFALPPTIVDGEGRPVNAVHGYLDMTARLQTVYRPDRIVHVFDHDWRPAQRVAVYPGYKAERPDDPPSLPPQFDLLREVLQAFGAPLAEAPGWEADDAVGALCVREEANALVDIVTGDRDLLQLVRDNNGAATVRVLLPVRGVGELAVFDPDAVKTKYGVPPERYVDFATLRGDPSDGLPGVKGIGEKTARTLVAKYPDLHALLADVAALPPRIGASLREAGPYLAAMQQVVPIRTDVAVQLTEAERDDARLADLGARYRLAGAIARLRTAMEALNHP
ncbi:MAG: 5'-3' exonuclease [Chloroflexota bacterium]|nr:5'-3' exonuclease [Chloroflexota bacterium]